MRDMFIFAAGGFSALVMRQLLSIWTTMMFCRRLTRHEAIMEQALEQMRRGAHAGPMEENQND